MGQSYLTVCSMLNCYNAVLLCTPTPLMVLGNSTWVSCREGVLSAIRWNQNWPNMICQAGLPKRIVYWINATYPLINPKLTLLYSFHIFLSKRSKTKLSDNRKGCFLYLYLTPSMKENGRTYCSYPSQNPKSRVSANSLKELSETLSALKKQNQLVFHFRRSKQILF